MSKHTGWSKDFYSRLKKEIDLDYQQLEKYCELIGQFRIDIQEKESFLKRLEVLANE